MPLKQKKKKECVKTSIKERESEKKNTELNEKKKRKKMVLNL